MLLLIDILLSVVKLLSVVPLLSVVALFSVITLLPVVTLLSVVTPLPVVISFSVEALLVVDVSDVQLTTIINKNYKTNCCHGFALEIHVVLPKCFIDKEYDEGATYNSISYHSYSTVQVLTPRKHIDC